MPKALREASAEVDVLKKDLGSTAGHGRMKPVTKPETHIDSAVAHCKQANSAIGTGTIWSEALHMDSTCQVEW